MSGDPYIDLETGVLRNRLGITDAADLARAESELTSYAFLAQLARDAGHPIIGRGWIPR